MRSAADSLRQRGRDRLALHEVVGAREVSDAASERTDVVDAGGKERHAVAGDAAERRLQPEDAAERRRHADRSTRVGAQGQRHQAGRHRGARSARGAARRARQVVRIARGPVVRVLGGEAVRVLVHVQGTDEHGAGTPQRGHHRGITLGRRVVAIDLRAGEGNQVGDIEKILDSKGRAGERTRIAARGDVRIARAASRPPARRPAVKQL